ncbi:MAG: YicC family protein [Ponticaulis sp.]|nr:YicC family protein [Ponticaulis sp.]
MLSSMTGFGSAGGETDNTSWQFEIKSVNGRGLDVRLHLPNGCEGLEAPIRNAIKSSFGRGNMQASLQISDKRQSQSLSVNTQLLTSLARRARLQDRLTGNPGLTRASDLFALRGVLSGEKSAGEISAESDIGKAIFETVQESLSALAESRQREGQSLHDVLTRVISDMEAVVSEAKGTADLQPSMIMSRLSEKVNSLLQDSRLSEDRLEQEVAILVTKADVTEELDRLDAHLKDGTRLINSKGPVGRKLDFLSQELLREANTMGSKSASLEMTRHSLSLKTLIDQFKEQAANVE